MARNRAKYHADQRRRLEQQIEDKTPYYRRVGTYGTSVTEAAALWRIEQREKLIGRGGKPDNG